MFIFGRHNEIPFDEIEFDQPMYKWLYCDKWTGFWQEDTIYMSVNQAKRHYGTRSGVKYFRPLMEVKVGIVFKNGKEND